MKGENRQPERANLQHMGGGAGLFSRIFQHSLASMAVRVCGLGLAFLSHIVLSRLLGPYQYGSYVIALGWAMVLTVPARLGLDNSALRFATIYREERRTGDLWGLVIFSLSAITFASLLCAGGLLAAKAVGFAPLGPIKFGLLVGVAGLILPLAALGWLSALVRTTGRIAAAQFYEQALRPALLIGAILLVQFSRAPLNAGLAMQLTSVTAALALVGIAIHARVAFQAVPTARPSFDERGMWLSVSGVLFLMAVFQEALNQIDIILLGILSTATEAAHFSAAWRLASLVPFGMVAIATVSGPLIASAHHRGNLGELARIARMNARFSTLLAVVVALALILIGRIALGLFGPGFEQAYAAMLILLGGGLINSFTGSAGYLLTMTGNQRAALSILGCSFVVSLFANILLIPRLGAIGSAIASSVAMAFWNLAMAAYARRQIGIDATALGRPPTVLQSA